MATIWDDKNHSSGEEFKLVDKASNEIKKAFLNLKAPYTKISDKEYNKFKNKHIIRIPDNLKDSPTNIIFYFSSGKSAYKVIGKRNLPNSSFRWSTAGTTANRRKMTDIKELASLYSILEKVNNKIISEEDLILKIKKEIPDVMDYWKEVYYTSALAHANLFNFNGRYIGELQQQNFSKIIYNISKKLTGKAADNWNPSDLWFLEVNSKTVVLNKLNQFKKDIDKSKLDKNTLSIKFKDYLDILLEEKKLIGISLKQIDRGKGSIDLVTYDKIKQKTNNLDFSKNKCFLRTPRNGLPAYGVLESKSGFNIKWGGKANGQKANMSLEGQMANSTHQLGAIDAKVIYNLAEIKKIKLLKDSDFSNDKKNLELLNIAVQYVEKNQKDIFNKYFSGLTTKDILEKYGFVETKRFIACTSYFKFINELNTDEIQDLYLLAKKVDKINPNYFIMH